MMQGCEAFTHWHASGADFSKSNAAHRTAQAAKHNSPLHLTTLARPGENVYTDRPLGILPTKKRKKDTKEGQLREGP